jgi:hypothetical protein
VGKLGISVVIVVSILTTMVIAAASVSLAAEICKETIPVTEKGQPTNDFQGQIIELYEDEGGGDPKKYRHLYLKMFDSICFVSKDEDRAAALNLIQLWTDRAKIGNALVKDAPLVTITGKVLSVHVGHYFTTPYAIQISKVSKQ